MARRASWSFRRSKEPTPPPTPQSAIADALVTLAHQVEVADDATLRRAVRVVPLPAWPGIGQALNRLASATTDHLESTDHMKG
jgi:hypothetical protein